MIIGICDDLSTDRTQLKLLLRAHTPTFTILEYASGEALLTAMQEGQTLDLLFLDICMQGLNGLDTAAQIRKSDPNIPILFLTTTPEFAVASYRVQAQDYLLKPVTKADLFESLNRQLQRLAPPEALLAFQSTHGILQIPIDQIAYLEAVNRKLTLVQKDGTIFESRDTIQSLEGTLTARPEFVRPHRSYLVNLHAVKVLDKEGFHMFSGALIPIARSHMANMKNQYLSQILNKKL